MFWWQIPCLCITAEDVTTRGNITFKIIMIITWLQTVNGQCPKQKKSMDAFVYHWDNFSFATHSRKKKLSAFLFECFILKILSVMWTSNSTKCNICFFRSVIDPNVSTWCNARVWYVNNLLFSEYIIVEQGKFISDLTFTYGPDIFTHLPISWEFCRCEYFQ